MGAFDYVDFQFKLSQQVESVVSEEFYSYGGFKMSFWKNCTCTAVSLSLRFEGETIWFAK
jgi:hypothetical protein